MQKFRNWLLADPEKKVLQTDRRTDEAEFIKLFAMPGLQQNNGYGIYFKVLEF